MPIPPPPDPANSITVTAMNVIEAAVKEIGALAPGESLPIEEAGDVLGKLQRVIDRFNARRPMVYSVNFTEFTLPVNTQPIAIGPGATFDVNQRPVKINSASLILNGGVDSPGQVEVPMFIRDNDWWAQQTIKNLTSTLPTDLYYSPDWPNGTLYFWPIPTAVNNVRLEMRSVLAEMTNYNQSFTLPPGYWDAVVYSLAESIGPMYEAPISPDLLRLKQEAIKAMEGNNITSPRMSSDSPSQTSTARCRPDFNFLTGLIQ